MGNPAWGNGYHKGFGDGARQGGIIGSVVTLTIGGVIAGGAWGMGKLRDRSAAKQQAARSTEDQLIDDGTEDEGAPRS